MPHEDPIALLYSLRRSFGTEPAQRKLRLLGQIASLERISARRLLRLQDTLDLMRAYPDDPAVLARVRSVGRRLREWVERLPDGADAAGLADTGFPGSVTTHPFSYDVVRGLDRLFPGCLEIDWDSLEDETALSLNVELLMTAAETEGMEDVKSYWPDWFAECPIEGVDTDLQYVLRLFDRSGFTAQQRECLYEGCALPIRYELATPGTGLCEVELERSRIRYQKVDMARERFALEPEIRKPLPPTRRVSSREGRHLLDLAIAALCSRKLEILPLTGANPQDVFLFDGPRAIQVVLAGVVPEQRAPLSSLFLFLVLKNGVPVAYGPAIPFLGCCELGINLFPEFRGFEIRHIYAQVMRVLHQAVGADLFFLTKYAMGVDNAEALESGTFWFYRKLGFRPSNPAVEALAQEEEARMRSEPGYRSDRSMLVRLSDTEAWLDLSNGRCRPFDFARLSIVLSRFFARDFDGDRPAAVRRCASRVRRALGIREGHSWSPAERRALQGLAPVLALLEDLPEWSRRDKAAMVRIIRGKGASRSEIESAHRMRRHPRFETSLRRALERG